MTDEKTVLTDKHFVDWHANTFPFGYGTGDAYTIPALKTFLTHCAEGPYPRNAREANERGRSYDYRRLEEALTPTVAWLLINILCGVDVLEYGTSPRGGWLTDAGVALRDYVIGKSDGELYELTSVDQEYIHCYPDRCNCSTPCANPMWKR